MQRDPPPTCSPLRPDDRFAHDPTAGLLDASDAGLMPASHPDLTLRHLRQRC